jgi:TATA-binding protein-associated factor
MPLESVISVQAILINMVRQNGAPPSSGLDVSAISNASVEPRKGKGMYVWQVRHSGLLGLKYLVAVRSGIFRTLPKEIAIKLEDEDVKPELDDNLKPVRQETAPDVLLKSVVEAALIG